MTGPVRAALMMFATTLRKIGKTGKGPSVARHRRNARSAMAQCFDAIPCWIMPSWRVAEQLPGELGSFDLVIMDVLESLSLPRYTLFGCCRDFFLCVVVRPHARLSEASTWPKKRVQTVMAKALLKKVRIMNRDAQRAAAVGSYLMISTTMKK